MNLWNPTQANTHTHTTRTYIYIINERRSIWKPTSTKLQWLSFTFLKTTSPKKCIEDCTCKCNILFVCAFFSHSLTLLAHSLNMLASNTPRSAPKNSIVTSFRSMSLTSILMQRYQRTWLTLDHYIHFYLSFGYFAVNVCVCVSLESWVLIYSIHSPTPRRFSLWLTLHGHHIIIIIWARSIKPKHRNHIER